MTLFLKIACGLETREQQDRDQMTPCHSRTTLWKLAAAATAMTLSACAVHARPGAQWPALPVPPHLEAFDVGSQLELHQMPLRIRGYITDRTVSQTAQWYREQVPGQWVQNKINAKTVLGQKQRDFFVTVEIEPLLTGASTPTTRVTTAVMLVNPGSGVSTAGDSTLERWASRLPVGTRIISHLVDHEASNSALHLVALNQQSLAYNVQHFQGEFLRLGYVQIPSFTDHDLKGRQVVQAANPEKMLFTAGNKEAILVLGSSSRGLTTIVLNLFVKKPSS